MIKNIVKRCAVLVMVLSFGACSDFLDPTLSTDKNVDGSVNSIGDLNALITGAYDQMNESDYYGRDFVVFGEVRTDNAYSNGNSGRFVGPGQFFLNSTDAYPRDTWTRMYAVISSLNIVIGAGIPDSGAGEIDYAKGQAYALRALVYMDLVRLYGQQATGGNLGVPIITTFNDGNIYPERATLAENWAQIGSDLSQAVALMDPALDGTTKTKVSSWLPLALQSRYYLYTKEWAKARDAAKLVIDGGEFDLTDNAWSGNESDDSIFELAFTSADNLGNTSIYFIYQNTVYGDISVTQDLFDSYDAGDVRTTLFNGGGADELRTSKYNGVNYQDATRVIRYGEVLLNYAEALTQLNDAGALAALNVIPTKRNATLYGSATVDNVLLERRKELAMEGHRYFDLMRYELDIVKVDPGQTFPDVGIPFGDSRLTFPIPEVEITANPSMVQNDDY